MRVDVMLYLQEQARCVTDTDNGTHSAGLGAPRAAAAPQHPPAPLCLRTEAPTAGAQAQKSRAACGSVVDVQNSVILPSPSLWLTFTTGTSIDLPLREAVSVASTAVCSSFARMSCTSSRNVPPVSSASRPKKPNT